jgi:hypothetical protein
MVEVKKTPRQKMIGMMHLVPPRFLALQVNSAILLKFLDDSLSSINGKYRRPTTAP